MFLQKGSGTGVWEMGYKRSEMIRFRVISAPLKVNDQLVKKACVVAPGCLENQRTV